VTEKIKIDILTLQDFISQYKATFNKHRLGADNEIYKWKAVKCFQDNWDIDAEDFISMVKASLALTNNLLMSQKYYPAGMIEGFSEIAPDEVRSMFKELFDDNIDLTHRISSFEKRSAELCKLKPEIWKSHYQTPNAISTYLWLRYPDKYYTYKYSVIKDSAQKLCGVDMPSGKIDRMIFGYALYDAICEELAKDSELITMSKGSLTDDCYPDDALKTLTIDVGYFITKHEIGHPQEPTSTAVNTTVRNILLYGTPGTGKTYSTVLYAVSIIEEKPFALIKAEEYTAVFERYLKYKEDGLIAFTTFHQSFGYEEFIEGIRPVLSDEDNPDGGREVEYEIHDGIFKAFCNSAIHGTILSNDDIFDKSWDALASEAGSNDNNYRFTRRTGTTIDTKLCDDSKFRVTWRSEQNSYNDLTKETIRTQWLTRVERESLKGGNRWLFDARQAIIDEMISSFNLHYSAENANKNHVFIIDEINRGNISKIFGELITLIEPSKRIGASEGQKARLPYSGQDFGVPDNVFLIGTMNTSDRSIAIIDTALRRRFSFVEMQPDSSLLRDIIVDGIDIAEMLDTMNNRITVLLDREHTIGHSYLLPLKSDSSVEKLSEIFENRIIPLLQEYFYDDYERIQLVLGDNQKGNDSTRFVIKKSDAVKLFGNVDIDYPEFYEVNREAFKKIEAYAFLN